MINRAEKIIVATIAKAHCTHISIEVKDREKGLKMQSVTENVLMVHCVKWFTCF